jgi:hypothetical protein
MRSRGLDKGQLERRVLSKVRVSRKQGDGGRRQLAGGRPVAAGKGLGDVKGGV